MTTQTPIFETLASGDVYILYIIDGCVEYLVNVDGVAILKRTCPDEQNTA